MSSSNFKSTEIPPIRSPLTLVTEHEVSFARIASPKTPPPRCVSFGENVSETPNQPPRVAKKGRRKGMAKRRKLQSLRNRLGMALTTSQFKTLERALEAPTRRLSPTPMATLQRPAPSTLCWQLSSGVELDASKRLATHGKLDDERIALLSQDWLHADHNTTKTWSVYMKVNMYEFGSAFFGLTESTTPHQIGRSMAFDVRGNRITGRSPLDVSTIEFTNTPPDTWGNRVDVVRITADLSAQTMTVRVGNKEPTTHPLDQHGRAWTTARLFVSLRERHDSVVRLS